MIKRSAILSIFLTLGSISLLVYTTSHPGSDTPAHPSPTKCSEQYKETNTPINWNIVSPAVFQSES